MVMMPFSTGIGLERAGIAGPIHWLRMPDSSTKTRNQKGSAGARPLPLRCLSKFFPTDEKINCLGNEVFMRTFYRWGGLVFIVDDFPNLMVIRTLSYWMRDFLSLSLSD